jgi:3-phenylpropionate/trans-cinnamate dioxygenase ferredoxin reductase subunit
MPPDQRHRADSIVIAGGGLAAQRAAETLRRVGHDGPVRIVCAEERPPYDRPPLSKGYLGGATDDRALSLRPPGWYAENDVELLLGRRATALDPARRELVLAGGERLPYGRLLIATGGTPRRLPGSRAFANVHHLRTVEDARALRVALAPGTRLVVVGAGFIGLEVAATAQRLGVEVTVVEAASAPLAGVLGHRLGSWFADLHRAEGVEVLVSARIAELAGAERVETVVLGDGRRLACDVLLVGVGMAPATEWLAGCGLDAGGVMVDEAGRNAVPRVFAAGDAARRPDPRLGGHVRSEHWEAAARQAGRAAHAMLGLPVPPAPAPSFWSDQYDVRIQYVGQTHGADGLAIEGSPAERDFTATFSTSDGPIGVLLVGRPHALPAARRLIQPAAAQPDERTAA